MVAKLQNERKNWESYPIQLYLQKNSLYWIFFWKKRDGSPYDYIQCDLVVPVELKAKFANFPPIFKNTEIESNEIGEYMQNYCIENDFLSISSEC